ncbi:MAG: response regulator [Gammaproteobacteria bacterium]|nr:response regulator [Gammaproteobacteria bacterium]
MQKDRSTWKGKIEFDLSLIEDEVKITDRFKRTSVVIVDYDMPQMNGLEFCRDIADRSVKKVMLTGAADEKIAVQAFNSGLIDRYISKNSTATLDMVVAFAHDLQRAYFFDQQRILQTTISLEPPAFLSDEVVGDWITRLRAEHGYVEHYLVGDPTGLIMLTADGELSLLMILQEDDVVRAIDAAEQYGAPPGVLRELRERRKLAYFYDIPDPSRPEAAWRDYLHNAARVRGAEDFWLALIPAPPNDIDFDPAVSSFERHLAALDQDA